MFFRPNDLLYYHKNSLMRFSNIILNKFYTYAPINFLQIPVYELLLISYCFLPIPSKTKL